MKKNILIWNFFDPWGLTVVNRLKKNFNIYHLSFLDEKNLGYILTKNETHLLKVFNNKKLEHKKEIERKKRDPKYAEIRPRYEEAQERRKEALAKT